MSASITRAVVALCAVSSAFALSVPTTKVDCAKPPAFCAGKVIKSADGNCYVQEPTCKPTDPFAVGTCTDGVCEYSKATGATGYKQCLQTCVPECTGKECGEDGCSGFCGSCASDKGCVDNKCVTVTSAGSCASPMELPGVGPTVTFDKYTQLTVEGDTTDKIHQLVPTCNEATAAPEAIYKFVVPEGKAFGIDFRVSGFDTVMQIMKGRCSQDSVMTSLCNDDGTPPGDYGSRIAGSLEAGTYYLMVDGYDSTSYGPFTLDLRFNPGMCFPKCDGAYCGDDGCGNNCGTCADNENCHPERAVCFAKDCKSLCSADSRECGQDGCGNYCKATLPAGKKLGSDGCNNDDGYFCVGFKLPVPTGEEGEVLDMTSKCTLFPKCDNMNPTCSPGCLNDEYCASDCTCTKNNEALPDLIADLPDLIGSFHLENKQFPDTSCAVLEGCVGGSGVRQLLRFTSTSINQGKVDLVGQNPLTNPHRYEFGECHGHYHAKQFAKYTLLDDMGKVVLKGQKLAYCAEDSTQRLFSSDINCSKKYTCEDQGIQAGWADTYAWGLDCSWLDVTGLPAGNYAVELIFNPDRVMKEASYDNNIVTGWVAIPKNWPTTEVAATPLPGYSTLAKLQAANRAFVASTAVVSAPVLLPLSLVSSPFLSVCCLLLALSSSHSLSLTDSVEAFVLTACFCLVLLCCFCSCFLFPGPSGLHRPRSSRGCLHVLKRLLAGLKDWLPPI